MFKHFRSYGDAVQYRGSGPSRAAKYGASGRNSKKYEP